MNIFQVACTVPGARSTVGNKMYTAPAFVEFRRGRWATGAFTIKADR